MISAMPALQAAFLKYPQITKVAIAVLGGLLVLLWLRWPYDATYDQSIRRAIEQQLRSEYILWAGKEAGLGQGSTTGVDQIAGQRYTTLVENFRPPQIQSILVRGRASTRIARVVITGSQIPTDAQPLRFYHMRSTRIRGTRRTAHETFHYSRTKPISYSLKVF
jgi:hypothetical protein